MSRGFVKEDDQEEVPMVPPRAYLPQGVPNYVSPSGMNELLISMRKPTSSARCRETTEDRLIGISPDRGALVNNSKFEE